MSVPSQPALEALPTLLSSRRHMPHSSKSLSKAGDVAQPPQKLPEAYSLPIRVRNTFIDTSLDLSPSLERFYREREVSTCPSADIGRFNRLFQDADACSLEGDDDTDTQLPSETFETRSVSEASPQHAAGADPTTAGLPDLAVAEACRPQVWAWGGQVLRRGLFGDGAPRAAEAPHFGCFPEQGPAGSHHGISGGEDERPACAWLPPALSPHLQAVDPPAPPDRPALGSAEMPSMGSAGHSAGSCKPCAFFHTVGCANGLACTFCHLCDRAARKRIRKAKLEAKRADRLRGESSIGSTEHDGGLR